MHESVMAWVAEQVKGLGALAQLDVLEVGSCDVNGSVRGLFKGCHSYLGIDVADGPGVDVVYVANRPGLLHEYEDDGLRQAAFDVVVSTEMLEHSRRPWDDFFNFSWWLRRHGHLVVTARGFHANGAFGWHNPPDRWRFGPGVLTMMAIDVGFSDVTELLDPQVPGWFLSARTP